MDDREMPSNTTTSTLRRSLLKREGNQEKVTLSHRHHSSSSEPQPKRISFITALLNLVGCTQSVDIAYSHLREEQRAIAWPIEKTLIRPSDLDMLIKSQLARYHAHYCNRSGDIPNVDLMPSWKLPLENAATSWLGDWRPSIILSVIVPELSFDLPARASDVLSEFTRHVRDKEAALDEEMLEHQMTCIFNLPFGRRHRSTDAEIKGRTRHAAAAVVGKEMRKMERLVGRAHRLRYGAIEFTVKYVLERNQAAEFLVAFAGIQELVHQRAARLRERRGPVAVTLNASG